MKDYENTENIIDTLNKCGITYGLTREEINKIILEELLRARIRNNIRQTQQQRHTKGDVIASGLFSSFIMLIVGLIILPTPLSIFGVMISFSAIICFIVNAVLLVFYVLRTILNFICQRRPYERSEE